MARIDMLAVAVVTATIVSAAARADEETVSYNLAPGNCSAPIAVPANNKPVTVSGTQIANGRPGVGQLAVIRSTSVSSLLWAGVDYYQGVEKGSALSDQVGTLMMVIDYAGYTFLKTAPSTHVQVCNSSINPGIAAGYVTFVY